ncbi:MAG: GNAT family N-acetyltransferase [Planifilum sp.]|jgi:RimJ/RimL family protein N-acetyltransferase
MEMQQRVSTLPDGRRLILRRAVPEDAEETIAFVQKIIGESDYLMLEPGEFRPSLGEQRELLERYARSDGHLYLIAEVDGEIVGILHFQPGKRNRNAHAGEFGMSVRKKFWGMSIGRLLLQFLLQWARQTGKIRKINLRVRVDNDRAIRLYRSLGFQVEGTITREFYIGGKFYDAHWMGIQLD